MTGRTTLRVLCLSLAAALCGCPSLTERAGPPPSVDRAQALEQAGDPAGAAAIYEALAAQNAGSDRNAYLLRAARDYVTAKRGADAARVLGELSGPLSPQQQAERTQLAAAAGARAAAPGQAPPAVAHAVPLTPGSEAPPATAAAPHVALLLPLSGRTAPSAASVRDGFMTAWYLARPEERPAVRIYDTGARSVAEVLAEAVRDGAVFIVGPLTREEVTAAAGYAEARPPVLALNFLPAEAPPPAQFYQFALSPEEEARLAARRVIGDHHLRGVALAPAGDWGTRVLAAFRQELQAGGGTLLSSAQYESARTDYSAAITEVTRTGESLTRCHRLEAVLVTKLQCEPRRRGDIDFIFAPAPATTERLLRPQLKFHFAGDIATYATSDAFEPDLRSNDELDGLMFPDMPWTLGGEQADTVRAATRAAWPTGGPRRGRLFAFGFDAFALAQVLQHSGVGGDFNIAGLTGRLSMGEEQRVRRQLAWAQVQEGELKVLPPDPQ